MNASREPETKRGKKEGQKVMLIPFIWVDHELEEVSVSFNDVQRDDFSNVSVWVSELIQFQVDGEHVFSDSISAWL